MPSAHARHVAVRLTIEALPFELLLGFADVSAFEIAQSTLFGQLSGARLPPLTYERVEDGEPVTLFIEMQDQGDDALSVQFRGAVETPRYLAQRGGFHWDFSKVLNALVMTQALEDGLVPMHGACFATASGATLALGASGAGKSSTSYAALAAGEVVLGSELAFVRGDALVCANSALTMDRAAIERFALVSGLADAAGDGPKLQLALNGTGPATIARVVFLQVHEGPVRVRQITDRRARMLLFENVVTQLPVTQLLSQETWPLWMPPSRDAIEGAMGTVRALSTRSPLIIEGHPERIVELLYADRVGG